MDEPIHIAEGDTPMRDGYLYAANGEGVRTDIVMAILKAWAEITPTGDPATALRSVNDGAINRVDNLARIAAAAALNTVRETT